MRLLRHLLMLVVTVCLALPAPALAATPLTLGIVAHAGGPFDDPELARRFAERLAQRLGAPVNLRVLASEAELRRWMSLFREVDCGWVGADYLEQLPAGELLPLATAAGPGNRGPLRLVARQGVDAAVLRHWQAALTAMGADAAETELLGALGITGFVTAGDGPHADRPDSTGTATPALVFTVPSPGLARGPDTGPAAVAAPPLVPVGSTAAPSPRVITAPPPAVARIPDPVPASAPPAAAQVAGEAPLATPLPAPAREAAPVALVADRIDFDWGEKLYSASGSVDIRQAELQLQADQVSYDQDGELYRANGAVVVQHGETRLSTDQLLWQASTRDAVAIGNVTLTDPEGELQGGGAHANLGNQTGRVTDGRIFLKGNAFHLAGEEIERLGQSSYRVAGGEFTTCEGEDPDWKFTAEQVNVDLGRYAVAREVWFEAAGLPLLYLPYMIFPVLTERQSGFLLPSAGYSDRKGAFLSLAWYQVIDRNLDATLYLDYLAELGVGKGLEFRYAFGGDSIGEFKGYHVSGFAGALEETGDDSRDRDMPDSYSLSWQHKGVLPGGVWLAADVEYVDKIEYFEEFGDTADQYTRDLTVSTVLAQRNWGKLNLSGFARFINDLEASDDDDTTLQRLPELGMTVPFYRLDENPLYSRTQLNATHFAREDELPATAGEPAMESGQRFLLRQGLSLVLKVGDLFEFTPEVAALGRYYTGIDGEESELIPEYSATLSTRLQRVYAVSGWGSIDRLQHSIEPQVTYRYVGDYKQDDLPYFDPWDRINDDNLISYALVNRLTGRQVDADGHRSYRQLAYLRLSQSYDIDEERDSHGSDPQPFSVARAELTISPMPGASLNVDSYLPVYGDGRFAKITASASYAPSPGNSVAIDYSYDRTAQEQSRAADPAAPTGEPPEYVGLRLATDLLAPVYAGFEQRYDLTEDQSLESVLDLEYRRKCWSLFLTLRSRSSDDGPDDNEIMLGFALSGLGRVGGLGSTLP